MSLSHLRRIMSRGVLSSLISGTVICLKAGSMTVVPLSLASKCLLPPDTSPLPFKALPCLFDLQHFHGVGCRVQQFLAQPQVIPVPRKSRCGGGGGGKEKQGLFRRRPPAVTFCNFQAILKILYSLHPKSQPLSIPLSLSKPFVPATFLGGGIALLFVVF